MTGPQSATPTRLRAVFLHQHNQLTMAEDWKTVTGGREVLKGKDSYRYPITGAEVHHVVAK